MSNKKGRKSQKRRLGGRCGWNEGTMRCRKTPGDEMHAYCRVSSKNRCAKKRTSRKPRTKKNASLKEYGALAYLINTIYNFPDYTIDEEREKIVNEQIKEKAKLYGVEIIGFQHGTDNGKLMYLDVHVKAKSKAYVEAWLKSLDGVEYIKKLDLIK